MFLNPLMLAGLGGAVLPVVLHLLNRARYRTKDWGAMMFLPGAQGRQEQSTKLKQLLLLLLRMAIVATLAIALARPVVGAGWAAVGADAHCSCVILLDNSASMAYDDGGGARIDAARRAALAVLAGLDRADEVNLLALGDEVDLANTPPASDLQTAAARVADLHLSNGRADIASGLAAAARLFSRSSASNRMLVIICDRQASSWQNVSEGFATNWRSNLDHHDPSQPHALLPELKFLVISVGSEGCENVAIDRVAPPAAAVVRDVPVPLDVTVHNFGRTAINALPISLERSNGHGTFQTTVDLPAGAQTTVTLTPQFSSVGQHVIHARISPEAHVPGGLTFDDQLDAIVNVVDPLSVCIISGDPSGGGEISQADALRLALMPYKSDDQKGPDLANVRIVKFTDEWPATLSTFRVLVLSDVPRLDEAKARAIEEFVFDGGGLLIAPGNLLQTQVYNDRLYRDGSGVLPAKLSPSIAPSKPQSMVPDHLTHPILAFLHGNAGGNSTAQISRYLLASAEQDRAQVIARLTDGSPMLIEKPFGRGRVLLCTTTLGSEWSTLPASTLFLPLVQSSIRYLASGGDDQRTLGPREPIDAHFTDAIGDSANVTLPDGIHQTVALVHDGERQSMRFTDTNQPGRYEVIVHATSGDKSEGFIVQSPRDESDLTPLSPQRWNDLQRWLGFSRTEPQAAGALASTAGRRGGREMWITLIALVLGLSLAESALSRRLSADL